MNTHQNYTAVELIAALSENITNSWKVAWESYGKEGANEFNALMSATVRPNEILCELIESQKSTNEHFKQAAFLKAQRELDKEVNKRLANSLPIKREANA